MAKPIYSTTSKVKRYNRVVPKNWRDGVVIDGYIGDEYAENKIAYIYSLSDPRTAEVRYIGKTDDLYRRYRHHLNLDDGTHKSNWVASLLSLGVLPKMEILKWCFESNWEIDEMAIIETYGEFSKLTNVALGGKGGLKYHTAETKAKLSQMAHKRYESVEFREKLSRSMMGRVGNMLGKHLSEATRAKISVARKGKPAPNRRPVFQYTLDGKFVRRWDYIKQAAIELGFRQGNIGACANGKCKKSHGFIWLFEENKNAS